MVAPRQNQFGQNIWSETYDPGSSPDDPFDRVALQDPVTRSLSHFGNLGWNVDTTNPWVQFAAGEIAPGLDLLWQAQGHQGRQGFDDYLHNMIASATGQGPANSGWLSFQNFGDTLKNLLSGSAPQQFADNFTGSAKEQYDNLLAFLQLGGAMSMTPRAMTNMERKLKNLSTEYAMMMQNPDAARTSAGFLDFLARNGFIQDYFDPGFVYGGGAPSAALGMNPYQVGGSQGGGSGGYGGGSSSGVAAAQARSQQQDAERNRRARAGAATAQSY